MKYFAFPCEQDTLSEVLTASIDYNGKFISSNFTERGRFFQVVMSADDGYEDVLNEIMINRYNLDGRRDNSMNSIVGGDFWREKLGYT